LAQSISRSIGCELIAKLCLRRAFDRHFYGLIDRQPANDPLIRRALSAFRYTVGRQSVVKPPTPHIGDLGENARIYREMRASGWPHRVSGDWHGTIPAVGSICVRHAVA
jgi:hypothetical protein